MGFDSVFQTSLFIKHLQKWVEKIGRVKKSTGGFTWAFNECVHGQAASQETGLWEGISVFARFIRHEQVRLKAVRLTAVP